VSHIYIYCADQYRVLRACPAFSICTMSTDLWAQAMLALPCGMLIACTFFKANCVEEFHRFHARDEGMFGYCKHNEALIAKCLAVLVLHVTFHLLVLLLIVPFFAKAKQNYPKTSYSECARRLAHSWFSVNPVHCLRSEWIYEHEPPWVFSRGGKEHLLPQNPEIGAYFCDISAVCEDYSSTIDAGEHLKSCLLSPKLTHDVPAPASTANFNFDPTKPVLITPRHQRSSERTVTDNDASEGSSSGKED